MTNVNFDVNENLAVIRLNRPEALNSLSADMVIKLRACLKQVAQNADISAIFFTGEGGRAFCAGGDIKAVRLEAITAREQQNDIPKIPEFFVQEYAMNEELYNFSKPTISFMDGITMGGGVGIAGACKYRIATERTRWAMPEVSIGFFPDVGAAHYLANAPYYIGQFLGLTGATLSNPGDLIKCGFATHSTASYKKDALIRDLQKTDDIESVLNSYCEGAVEPQLPYDLIEKCFAAVSVEEILEKLQHEADVWADETAALIKTKSPMSLKIAFRHIEMARREKFSQVIKRDLTLAGKFMAGDDFIEGVRAMVVDKDKSPRWVPSRIEDVSIEQIEGYFN